VRRYLHGRHKAPLVVAALIATPLYFLSLMAVSLAIEKPTIKAQWHTGKTHHLVTIYAPPTGWEEAKIWVWALVPTAILLAVGLLALTVPYGVVVSSLTGIGIILAINSQVDRWADHHSHRFPFGEDLVPDSSPGSTLLQGEWEDVTVAAIRSMSKWLIGLAIGSILVLLFVEYRRRHGKREAAQELPPEVASGTAEIVPTPPPPVER
jgi:hypothetical protein